MRTLVLDYDGLVAPRLPLAQTLRDHYGITDAQARPFLDFRYHDCFVGKADLVEELSDWLGRWGIRQSAHSFVEELSAQLPAPDNRVLSWIHDLTCSGWRCCLATNQEKYRAQAMKSRLGTAFWRVFTSAELGVKKPDLAFYQMVAARLRVQPSSIVFFDDTLENVQAARRAGWCAHHFKAFESLQLPFTRGQDEQRSED